MFNSSFDFEKYLGWFERLIDIIIKLFSGGSSSTTTTTTTETTTEAVAETTTVA